MENPNLEYEIDKDLEEELLYSILEEDFNNDDNETLNVSSKPKKRKFTSKKKKKFKFEIKIRTVLLLLITLIANTYAWFIFNTTVDSQLDVHIKNWQFELEAGDITEDFVFVVDEIYPGMEEVSTSILANNKGETDAKLNCTINYVRLLEDEYFLAPENDEDREVGKEYKTADELLDMILNDYPFKIEIYVNGSLYDGTTEFVIAANDPTTTIEYKINWPYETGSTGTQVEANDQIDTEWGERAYNFAHDPSHDGEYSIEIRLKIIAIQVYEETTPPSSGS